LSVKCIAEVIGLRTRNTKNAEETCVSYGNSKQVP